jgi:hypothetical protein
MKPLWLPVALGVLLLPLPHCAAQEKPAPAPEVPRPELKEADNPDHDAEVALGQVFRVKVKGLTAYAAARHLDLGRAELYLNGVPTGLHPERNAPDEDTLSFFLRREAGADVAKQEESRQAWARILGRPDGLRRDLRVRLALENDGLLPGELRRTLLDIPPLWASLGAGVVVVALALFVWLAWATNIIRDTGPDPGPNERRSYSLARTQMAFWFFLVLASYLLIATITGDLGPIPGTVLGLMGIATATAVGGVAVGMTRRTTAEADLPRLLGQQQQVHAALAAAPPAAAATPATDPRLAERAALDERVREATARTGPSVSAGFWRDLVSDADGPSLHRFQIVVWTVVLGGMFVVGVWQSLAMPQFDPSLLLLMGISAGAYVLLKVPEKAA